MTAKHVTVTDALIARALAERAQGPEVDLVPAILATTTAIPRARGMRVRLRFTRRSVVLVFAVAALSAALVTAGIVGSGILRPKLIDRPLPRNGPLTFGGDSMIRELDPVTGRWGLRPLALLRNAPVRLDWSRDGGRLAIATETNIAIYEATTGTTRILSDCAWCGVAWSPDATELAIGDGTVISVVDPGDGHIVASIDPNAGLSPNPDASRANFVMDVDWSPDGRQILYAGVDPSGATAYLSVVGRDGSDVRSIVPPTDRSFFVDPEWSPDGNTIGLIVEGAPGQDGLTRPLELWLLDRDGASKAPAVSLGSCACLGFTPGLAWSPEGRTLAVRALMTDSAGIYFIDADGTNVRLVSDEGFGPMAWRPIPSPTPE
jgi:WD40 repeat protein